MAAFLLNKYGAGGSRLAAAEAVATSADEEDVCEGEKTREERDAELAWRGRVAGRVRQCRGGWGNLGKLVERAAYTVSCGASVRIESKLVKAGHGG